MSDDLVKQAREAADSCKLSTEHMWLVSTMADRIEKLEAEVKRLEQQLKMARRLAHRPQPEYPPEIGVPHLKED